MKFFRFLGFKKKPNAPWSKYYHKKDMDLFVPDISLYDNFSCLDLIILSNFMTYKIIKHV